MATDLAPPPGRGGDRRHQFPGRRHRINLRLDDTEHKEITTAAARCDLTPAGYCAEAALANARGTAPSGDPLPEVGVSRGELAQLQRRLFDTRSELVHVGDSLDQAVAASRTTGVRHVAYWCQQVIERLEATIAEVDRRLR